MFGGSPTNGEGAHEPLNSRPAKRQRNISGPGDVGFRESMPVFSAELPNQLHMRPEAQGTASSTAGKGRGDDKNSRKLSCKECRRLKLKCDRNFPCQSCVKRGCGSLCPEGALTSGRGSRFILANTEQLHEKIAQLSERVRELEVGLSKATSPSHPLLAPDFLQIKTSQELYGATQSTQPSTSAVTLESSSRSRDDRLRESVYSMSLDHRQSSSNISTPMELDAKEAAPGPPEVPPDILQLSATFPFPWSVDLKIRKRIRESLPPREEAQAICDEARKNALWQYNLDATESFIPNLLNYCYTTPIENLSPRRLALLLMILSIGSQVDLTRPLGYLHAEAYHHLARASVCEIPLMEEPDFDVLHALFFMIWYHLIFSDNKKAIGYAWNLMGFVAKLAQGLGLHRDSPRRKAIPEENDKRRAVFWELLNMDCRMSLSLGRPPSISLAHVDIPQPVYEGPGIYVPREEIAYHKWKSAFLTQCLSPMLEAMIAVDPPGYSKILHLDKAVRDFGVPSLLDDKAPFNGTPRFLVMQRALLSLSRDIALLQLHRKYFTQAMSDCTSVAFDLHHKYAPSVISTYLNASNLISTVEDLFNQEQHLSVRFLHFWFNSFSAAVTLSLLISRAPSTPLASHAFQSLERVCQLFRRAAVILPFSGKAFPVLQKLAEKSRLKLQPLSSGISNERAVSSRDDRHLPTTFDQAHPTLLQTAERVFSSSFTPTISRSQSRYDPTSESSSSETWLPDIYQFSSVGLGIEDRYNFATTQPTPFTPSSPRVAENKDFNFEHGDLTVGLVEETSYMAWF